MNSHIVYEVLNLVGTFVFAISGAVAARQRGLDLFGVLSVSFIVACGGGVIRDVCIGATPPAAFSDWHILAISILASLLTIVAYKKVIRLRFPVLFFDAVGLGLFAVSGAQKSLAYGHGAELAILLGTVSAVGGGVIRDILLSRVPAILEREIYASAALLGAIIFVASAKAGVMTAWTPWFATIVCCGVRLLSLHYSWRLPVYREASVQRNRNRAQTEA